MLLEIPQKEQMLAFEEFVDSVSCSDDAILEELPDLRKRKQGYTTLQRKVQFTSRKLTPGSFHNHTKKKISMPKKRTIQSS